MKENYVEKSEKFRQIIERIKKEEKFQIVGGNISFFSYLISSIFNTLDKNFLVILPDEKQAEIFYQDIYNFTEGKFLKFLPSPDYRKETEISQISFERIKVLVDISNSEDKFILISYPGGIIKKIPEFKELSEKVIKIEKNKEIRRDFFINFLFYSGYEEKEIVEIPGEFARRGAVVDVFPLNSSFPLRINFFGNKIESIRKFEVSSQKSFEKIDQFFIYPVTEESLGKEKTDLFSEIKNNLIFLVNPDEIKTDFVEFIKEKFPVDTGIINQLKENSIIISSKIYDYSKKFFFFKVFPANERFRIFQDTIVWNSLEGEKIIIFSDSLIDLEKLKEKLKERNINYDFEILNGNLSSSFYVSELNLSFLSINEIFSRNKIKHPFVHKYNTLPLSSWEEIKEGDYVVHINEGIGKFVGMERIKSDGKEEEFIVIEYEGKDKLYVPVSQISLIHKYVGSKKPALSKLGSKNWIKVKEKVKNSIRDLATDLYRIYVERKKEKGFKFLPDDDLQKEFEDAFPYQETEDQLKAIKEVKMDMESDKIMDRIICGDSGYGKTEVAMRAAFKCVLSGKQVVVLVPTTVLALQHYLTFKERFSKFPVVIEMLSRLVNEKRQKEIIKDLKEGKIDIIIGTHRLLQDDVEFKNIGLLIIDEEQRFGVVHKEKIRTVFRKISVLTLTATPIPRTLNMALSGIKDISLIETPPEGRLSVITYVGRYNPNIVREAILREVERKGQVFYLHNYIYDIYKVKEKIQKLVSSVKVEVAHGRMKPEHLSEIMERFRNGEIDVLVATTIVENGIDIPNANTLIVDNALKYGLSDLYQLRGRVGRYKWRAYAYFLIPPEVPLSEKARERLKAIQELNSPGSGYKIALKDLEIRGAGNILGKEQHGFIEMVGFNLYCQFWKEIMGEIKGEKVEEEIIETNFYISDEYVKSPSLRFYLYKEIGKVKTEKEAKILIEELNDKFGYLPKEIENIILSRINP